MYGCLWPLTRTVDGSNLERNDFVTLINIFTVEPARQQQLIDLLIRATTTTVENVSGFISASFHRSFDGTKLAVYAQWRSNEDYQAMRRNPSASAYMEQALALAAFEPGMYEVMEVLPKPIGSA
jgi:quinol monooxygenase YgiN